MTPFLKGERIFLRGLVHSDAGYIRWFNDAEVCVGNSHHVFPLNETDSLEHISYSKETKDDLILAICTFDDAHIGNIALQNIHPVYRSADFSIIIGEKDYWSKGYGKEAARLLINHGFSAMNLHRISIATFETNDAMRKLALSLGFQYEGWRHEAAYKHGQYVDVIEYGRIRG